MKWPAHIGVMAIASKRLVCDLDAEAWSHSFLATLTQMAETQRHE